MGARQKIRIATHVEVTWLDAEAASHAACPNCNFTGSVKNYLDIDYRPPDAIHHFVLQICPHCGVRFTDNPETMDYATDQLIEIGWHVYQTQIGAGVWPIAAPLTRISKPPGARVLEIGGAYGFGLDFCIRARGWTGEGFDPSPLAAYGARELDLNIIQDYFTEAHLTRGPYDVVIATEVIEHLGHPPEFLSLMRRALADDGILVLSTPDAAWITPAQDDAQLMTLLSPGAHVVLQTAESLNIALAAAGFSHVIIQRSTTTLVAYASASPFALNDDPAAGRAMYRNYLVARSKISAPESDLQLGFAGRALFEAANDADPEAAAEAWATMLPAVQSRFDLDLETLHALPEAATTASLAELARLIPLGLGMILFGRANLLAAQDLPRENLLPIFRLAAAAAAALQSALAQRSLADGLSASIINAAEGEIALCRAEAGDAEAVNILIDWSHRNASTIMLWRGFTGLVNAGAITAAQQLRHDMQLEIPEANLPAGLRRDALLSLANFALAPGGDTMRAFDYAEALHPLDPAAFGSIILQAFTRLVNASRYADAIDVSNRFGIENLIKSGAGKTARDAKLAQMVLDLAVGDPAEIPARLAGIDIEPERRDILLLEAFIRLTNASRYAEASEFKQAHEIPILAFRVGGTPAQNTNIALSVLDLAVGDPLDIPERLASLSLDQPQQELLLLEAFIRLTNASRYQDALTFAAQYEIAAMATRATGKSAADAAIALAVLDLAAGDPAMVPARLDTSAIDPAQRTALLLGAFTGLVNSSRIEEAESLTQSYNLLDALNEAQGEAAADARIAAVLLDFHCHRTNSAMVRLNNLKPRAEDASVLNELYVDGFVRLVNEGKSAEARKLAAEHTIPRQLENCPPTLRQDAQVARVILAMQPGGTPAEIMECLQDAKLGGLPEDRLLKIKFAAFVCLVNGGNFAEAATLSETLDAEIRTFKPPYEPETRNALFAAGVLALQHHESLPRAVALFARLRDYLIKLCAAGTRPDELFWPALRGEIMALRGLRRHEEANVLLTTFLTAYTGAPDDLLAQAP